MFKYITALAVAMALAPSAHADGISDYAHLEIGAGVSWYSKQGDNTWYQLGAQHSLGLSAPVLSAGLAGPIHTSDSWGIDWHINYVSLGHVSSQCECTPMDQNYSVPQHKVLNLYAVENANFVGNGNAQGVSLTLEPYLRYRGWRFGAEGGLFVYRPDWNETIYNWAPGPDVAQTTIHANTPHALQLGKVVGVSVGRGNFSVAYQHYFLPTKYDSTHSPAIWKGADVLMVKYQF